MPKDSRAGFSVFWREFGDGPDRALLLHCALAHSKVWGRFADQLADDVSMVAPDMLGHGRSEQPDMSQHFDDQLFATSAAFLTEPSHVIGHSFGATIALRLAMELPDMVKSLTLIEPVFFAAARASDPQALQTYLTEAQSFADPMSAGDWPTAAQHFTKMWGDSSSWDQLSDVERSKMSGQMPFIAATQGALFEDTAGLLVPGRLEAIACPVVLIRGGNSNPVMAAIHKTLARRIPTAADKVVPNASHMVPITHPKVVADHVRHVLHVG